MNNSGRRIAYAMGFLLSAALMVTWATPVAAGSCLVAEVPRDFVLPDGSSHPAGDLRVCMDRQLNPRIELQLISVSGTTLGLFRGETFVAEGATISRPVFYFAEIERSGEWTLLGLAQPPRSRSNSARSIRFSGSLDVREARRRNTPTEPVTMIVLAAN